jgi:sec-independent protein translocase protein TatB
MFDIGFPELILIAVVGLLVIGPERLPDALRTLGLWIGRMRRSFTNVKTEIEKEIGMDEIRRQLHNEAVMEEMKRIERDVRSSVRAADQKVGNVTTQEPAKQEPAKQELTLTDSTAGEQKPQSETPDVSADSQEHGDDRQHG